MTNENDNNLYARVTFEDMELAWEHVRRSKRWEVKDWLSLKIHGHPDYIEKYLSLLSDSLNEGNYFPSEAYHFYHPKTDRSLRRFEFLYMDDRLVYQHLCNLLIRGSYGSVIDLHRSQRVFGNIPIDPSIRMPFVFRRVFNERKEDGSLLYGQYDLFRLRVLESYDEYKDHEGQPWLVRTDIRSFFYSIDHEKLITLLEERGWLPDVGDRALLCKCLSKWTPEQGKGIPVGYECSDYIGNLYLSDLDMALKDFRVHRYVDDTYIFVDSFEEVKDVLYRMDMVLGSLGLQRNTSKTQTYRLPQFRKDQLQKVLGESLSMLAEEQQDDVEEEKRQGELLEILENSFDPHTTSDFFEDKITSFGHVAFVLNRLKRKGDDIKELAYHVLDQDLRYAYQALKYLYCNHADERLVEKLWSILAADYEPRTLKALALHYLQKLNVQTVEQTVQTIFAISDPDDWYLIRTIMKEVIEPSQSAFSSTGFESLTESKNPHVQLYAHWLAFKQVATSEDKCELVHKMFQNENLVVKKLGIYLAHLYELLNCVDASLLEPHLRTWFPVGTRNEIEGICRRFDDVFGIPIDPAFPIGKYFGSPSYVAQIMRNIYDSNETDATDFVENTHMLVNSMLTTTAETIYGLSHDVDVDEALSFFDDEKLNDFVSAIDKDRAKKYVKYKRKKHLRIRFTDVISIYVDKWHKREGLRMRDEVFICYAHEDKEWKDRLIRQMKPHIRDAGIPVWNDEKIKSGQLWDDEIKSALSRAKVAVPLVTPSFLASDYISETELPRIFKAAKGEGLEILWIHVIPSARTTELWNHKAAHDNPMRTLQKMFDEHQIAELEETLVEICQKIADCLTGHVQSASTEKSQKP